MLVLMRAAQLGLFSCAKLKELAEDQSRSMNLTEEEWEEIDSKVTERNKGKIRWT